MTDKKLDDAIDKLAETVERDEQPRLPVMVIKSIDNWGASLDGTEVLIGVTSAAQSLRIHLDFQTLVNLVIAGQAARTKAASNAAGGGADLAVASPVNKYLVGYAPGAQGVLLVMNGGTPHETIYSVPFEDAISMGKMLMAEGAKRRNIANAVKGVVSPPKKKLIILGAN